MTGWNLPPGCEDHHIPGNRPIDIMAEKIAEEILDEGHDCPQCEKPMEWDDDSDAFTCAPCEMQESLDGLVDRKMREVEEDAREARAER